MSELGAVSARTIPGPSHAATAGKAPQTGGAFAALYRQIGMLPGTGAEPGDAAASETGSAAALTIAVDLPKATATLDTGDGDPLASAGIPDPAPSVPAMAEQPAPDPVVIDPAIQAGNALPAEASDQTDLAPMPTDPLQLATGAPTASQSKPATADAALSPAGATEARPTATPTAKDASRDKPAAAATGPSVIAETLNVEARAQATTQTRPVSTAAQSVSTAAQSDAGATMNSNPARPATAGTADTGAGAMPVAAQPDLSNDPSDARDTADQKRRSGPPSILMAAARREPDVDAPATALADIVRTLPPVVQAQLDPVAAPPPLASPAFAPVGPSTTERLGDHVIDMSVRGQWIDRMAQEIASLADGSGHSRFQLSPPNLGRIQVDLWQGEAQTHVRLLTETEEAARHLREGQAALETHARMSALALGSVTVEKSGTPLDQNRDQPAGQNSRQNPESTGQGQQQANGDPSARRGGVNQGGVAAVMGNDRRAEPAPETAPARAADPRVRFA